MGDTMLLRLILGLSVCTTLSGAVVGSVQPTETRTAVRFEGPFSWADGSVRVADGAPWWSFRSPCPAWDHHPPTISDDEAFQRASDCLERQLVRARDISDVETEALLLTELGRAFWWRDDEDQAREYFDLALTIVNRLSNPCWTSFLLRWKAELVHSLPASREAFKLAVAAAQDGGCEHERALAKHKIALTFPGAAPAHLEFLDAALADARVGGDPGTMVMILGAAAIAYADRDDRRALDSRREIVDILSSRGDRHSEMLAVWNLGIAYERLGDIDGALPFLRGFVDYEAERGSSNTRAKRHLDWLLSQESEGSAP